MDASSAAAKILKKHFGNSLEAHQKKSAADFYTKADLESEKNLINTLHKSFPNYNILSEESGLINNDSEFTFIVDPLDGTSNFALGIPNFSISIGLFENNNIIAGVVNNPMLGYIYAAEKGKGAFLNKKRIEINSEKDIKKSNVAYDCDYGHYLEKNLRKLMSDLEEKNIKRFLINMSPALDLCRLAEGKIECFINNGNEIYDYAAGKLIVKEAGGVITDFYNNVEINDKDNKFIASNGLRIHKAVVECLGALI